MPAVGEDGGVYVMTKDENGKHNICILERRSSGQTKQGRMVLTEQGEEWITSEITKGATIDEVIAMLGVSSKTLYAKYNNERVKRAIEKGTETCNMRLRKAQVNAALNGNTSMLIWLGKNRLGQSDSPKSMGNEILADFAQSISKASRSLDRDVEGWEERWHPRRSSPSTRVSLSASPALMPCNFTRDL